MPYRPDIDGLRAIAVILVVLFHASPKKYPSGFIGVDIFFVISGYLITSIMLKDLSLNRFTIKEFYIYQVAEIDFNPKRCANLRKIRFSDKSQDCRISSLIIKEQQSEYRELIKDIKVNKLDPLDIQCDKDWCHAKIDGSVLYRDKNHLSIDGSNYISRKLLKTKI